MVKKSKDAIYDLLTFLVVVAHQPYDLALQIPIHDAIKMGERTAHWVGFFLNQITSKSKDSTAENIIKGLEPPEFWVKDGKRKRKEMELQNQINEPKPTNQ